MAHDSSGSVPGLGAGWLGPCAPGCYHFSAPGGLLYLDEPCFRHVARRRPYAAAACHGLVLGCTWFWPTQARLLYCTLWSKDDTVSAVVIKRRGLGCCAGRLPDHHSSCSAWRRRRLTSAALPCVLPLQAFPALRRDWPCGHGERSSSLRAGLGVGVGAGGWSTPHSGSGSSGFEGRKGMKLRGGMTYTLRLPFECRSTMARSTASWW